MIKKILIIGYGDIGKRLVKILDTNTAKIFAISRNDIIDEKIINVNWNWLSNTYFEINESNFDSVIIIPKPSELNEQGYKDGFLTAIDNILNSLKAFQIKKVIAISSTRVYGDNQKGLINEQSDQNPTDYRGRLIKEYESKISKSFIKKVTILRFSGLYDKDSKKISYNSLHRDQAAKIIQFFINNNPEKSDIDFYNCSEDSEVKTSIKSISNLKLKSAGFDFK